MGLVQKQNTSSHHNASSVYPYGSPPPSQSHSSSPYTPPPPPPRQSSGDVPVGAPHSAFPPGTDPNVITSFQLTDRDGNGFIDDKELQLALSSDNQCFSLSTVHLLMYLSTNTNNRKIGPKEFTEVYYNLQNYKEIFERFDRDRSGKIGVLELGEALLSLGFSVSPVILDLLMSKFDKSSGETKAIEYDNFVGCCLTVKGLTEKFKKETAYSDSATFTYESFMSTVLPFLLA